MTTHPLSARLLNGEETCGSEQCRDKSIIANCLCASAAYELDRLYREVKRLEAMLDPKVVLLDQYRRDPND
jgi:hypothetical protein